MRFSLWKKMFSKNHAIFQQENFRLCLFWVKITSGNAFPYLRVFGCARKMHFPEMVFSWPCVRCKLISVFILPSNTIFQKIEKERELSESEIEEEERGREHTPPVSQASAREIASRKRLNLEPRAIWLRLHHSTSNRTLRLRRLTSPSHRSRSQSQDLFVVPDRKPRFVVPDRDHHTPKLIILDPKTDRSPSLPSSLNLTVLWFFFFLGFICVSELRDEIIYLFGKWEKVRKCVFCVILIFVGVVVWWWCFGGCGFWLPVFAAVGWISVWKICRKIAFSTQ